MIGKGLRVCILTKKIYFQPKVQNTTQPMENKQFC